MTAHWGFLRARRRSLFALFLLLFMVASQLQTMPAQAAANPLSGSLIWRPVSSDSAPSARSIHRALWTGTEMIVWGGYSDTPTAGGRYDPSTNTWKSISTDDASVLRAGLTLVWTGTEMIVWGGRGGSNPYPQNGGARYNPTTDSWTSISYEDAPSPRENHTAIWTGTEMIVWGGQDGQTFDGLNDGARYNPATDTWTPLPAIPGLVGRWMHTAVWTGSEMIVWGGDHAMNALNDGARYNPSTNQWTLLPANGAPLARECHTAIWTGSEMIVWGGADALCGFGAKLNDGARYNPSSDSWSPISTTDAPSARMYHTAVWSGTEMTIWGGYAGGQIMLNDGARYNPSTDTWVALPAAGAPAARTAHTAVWTGTEMIVWGGVDEDTFNDGARLGGLYTTYLPLCVGQP